MRSGKKGEIAGPFVYHRLEMRESFAWRALPHLARRILDRLEVEHMHHGSAHNGRLKCTYHQFEEWGIRKASVARAIREAVALGFLVVERAGYRAAGGTTVPSEYRLTYLWGKFPSPSPTDEWETVTSAADAQIRLVKAAKQRRYDKQPKKPKTTAA